MHILLLDSISARNIFYDMAFSLLFFYPSHYKQILSNKNR